jgi:hypothetical protein
MNTTERFNDIMTNPEMYSDIRLVNGNLLSATINGCDGDDAEVVITLNSEQADQANAAEFVG